MKSGYKAHELAAIEAAGYMGINDDILNRVASELRVYGPCEISFELFARACFKCGVDPNCFEQEDLDKLVDLLNNGGHLYEN